ncbi:hypothetical protein K449DRAFT_380947 [Hypoxylon sp. EC38]|nr:hypothetical protein K449DRAFT_380947 [Hypoxylon sp. EC38]
MHASTYFILSLFGVAHGLPTFLAEAKRALIQIKPVIELGIDLNNDNSCLGVGVSVCDPITVNSTTSSTAVNNSNSSKAKLKAKEDSSDTKRTSNTSNDTSSDNSLVDISPELGLDLNLNNNNGCLGIGISACDPITVGSDVTKSATNNNNESSSSKKSNESSSTTDNDSSSSNSNNNNNSNSDSDNDGSLLNLSPEVSPDVTLNNDNSCQGVGISACDPITVKSNTTQTSNN